MTSSNVISGDKFDNLNEGDTKSYLLVAAHKKVAQYVPPIPPQLANWMEQLENTDLENLPVWKLIIPGMFN